MHSELNTSSYYRANPFYQQGYVPDSALRNRKSPNYIAQIPQGEKYFQPSNRKHFQRLGYYSTIAQENIIHNDNKDYEQSPARDKEFFRSLNTHDIQGATPNTIISQAVKNRMKAQEHLMKRNQQQKQEENKEKLRIFSQMQDNRKREEALSKMRRQKQPNYHELVKKMRTEESEGITSPQQQKRKQTPNIIQQNNQNNQYHSQLQQTEYQIMQLQKQLRQVRRENQQNSQSLNKFNPQEQREDTQNRQNNKYNKKQTQSIIDRQYQPSQYNRYLHENNLPIKKTPSQSLQTNPQKINYYQLTNKQQPYPNYNNIQYNNDSRQRSLTDNAILKPNIYKQQLIRQQQEQNYPDPRTRKQSRQQHRKYNPTFLSFGSASIGLAGKNIVGL